MLERKLLITILITLAILTLSSASAADEANFHNDTQTFTDLSHEIEIEDSQLNLTADYCYENTDGNCTNGIEINKNNFTINGNGHSIDGANKSTIFKITGTNVTICNLILKNSPIFINIKNSADITTENVTFTQTDPNSESDFGGVLIVNTKGYSSINDKYSEVYAGEFGSAIYALNSELTITNVSMANRQSISWSMIYAENSDLTILNTTFANLTSQYATAVYGEYTGMRIRNSRFINLTAKITAGAIGIRGNRNVTIEECQFINVTSARNGGAIFIDANYVDWENEFNETVTLTDTLFDSCSSQFGGAYLQLGGIAYIFNCSFTNNHAYASGGAVYISSTYFTYLIDSIFENNTAQKEAGTVHFDYGGLFVECSSFTNNHANVSGAIYLTNSKQYIFDSTFENNTRAIYSKFDFGNYELEGNNFTDDEVTLGIEEYSQYVFDINQQIVLNPINITGNVNDSYFDLRQFNATTPVKDQGHKGACWAFSSCAAFESAYLIATGETIDLSENNLFDLLLKYSLYGNYDITEGVPISHAQGYFISGVGAVDEKYDTYDELGKITSRIATNDSYPIFNTRIVNSKSDDSSVTFYKELLLEYGPLVILTNGANSNSEYYNSKTFAEYCNDSELGDHAVTIIGWNDTFSASNFNTPQPPGDGAWIIKNSWGDDWGDEGYYYISYYEPIMVDDNAVAYIFKQTPNYNKVYEYDIAGYRSRYSSNFGDYCYYTNYYESNGNDMIAGVGTYFNKTGVDYEITIYVNGDEVHTQTGKSSFEGYETIELNRYIPINEGDSFAVKMKNTIVPIIYNLRQYLKPGVSIVEFDGLAEPNGYNEAACLKVYTVAMGSDSFKTLKEEIDNAKDIFTLTHDYRSYDDDDENGITINKTNFIINGNGHVIDGAGNAKIFQITGTNVTICNLIFKNAIYFIRIADSTNITTKNVTFQDCNNTNRNDYGAVRIIDTKGYTSINDRYSEVYAKKYGSAIYAKNSEMTISNISIANKESIHWSAIFAEHSDVTILNTTFANLASKYATAVYTEYGQTRIRNSRFINLSANRTAGAIAIKEDSNVTIEDCQFINITSAKNGGAMFIDINGEDNKYKFTGTVSIRNVLFDNCSSQFGGAYLQLGGKLEMKNCSFKNNRAQESGGAIYISDAYTHIADSTFENNTSPKEAGAIHCDYSVSTIENCSFKNNRANKSGAIYLLDSHYEITDSTFKNNIKAIHSLFEYEDSYAEGNDYGDDEISLNNTEYLPYVFDISNHIPLNPINITGNINDPYFDLRQFNATTPVKNQGYRGSCWVFASVAAFESAYLMATGKEIDISENYILNSLNRYSIFGSVDIVEGGYACFAQGYILSSIGAIDEKYDAYDELGKISPIILANNTYYATTGIYENDDWHVNITFYKELLLKYGALVIYTEGNDNNGEYYNNETYASYCNDSMKGDHSATLVGWNDTFSASNFKITPPGDGAWIIKNSWGEDFGDEGYYYISYYEPLIAMQFVEGYAFTDISYNKLYQYDLAGYTTLYYSELGNPCYYTTYFESNGNDLIAAIQTPLEHNDDYEITIYVNDTEVHRQSGKTSFTGYQTIELDKLIEIKEGDIFSVKIKSSYVYTTGAIRHHIPKGTSIMEIDGMTYDLADTHETACLRVFTLPVGSDSFKTLEEEINNAGDVLTLTHDYAYNIEFDSGEITINRTNLLINGNGHTIDGANKTTIFKITGTNITICNLILKNAPIFINMKNATSITTANVTFTQTSFNNESSTGAVKVTNTKGYASIHDKYSEVYAKKYGSAIDAYNSEMTIINATITNRNSIEWSAILTENSNLTILNTTFANLKSKYATAVYADCGHTRIINSRFINLTANITAGAVAMKRGNTVTIEDCQFINVTSTKNGGAVFIDFNEVDSKDSSTGTVLICNVVFDNCSSQFGGAYLQLGGIADILNCNFTNNRAHESGGAIYLSDADTYIADSIFENNTAQKEACAIHSDYSYLTMEYCSFENNHANKSGAIYLLNSYYQITDSTFKNNTKAIHSIFDHDKSYQDANDYGDDEISLNNTEYTPYVFDISNHIILNPINITGNINDTYFDLRQFNATTPVKNQGYKGACWAFATASAFESAYLIATGKTIDISENNIANLMTRYSIYGTGYFTEGGTGKLALGYLLSGLGAIDEEYDTYDELGKISTAIQTENIYPALNSILIYRNADDLNIALYKEMMLKYGALSIDVNGATDGEYYNSETYALYCNGSSLSDHMVALIGWDDTFNASNFKITPPGDGAWIAKNNEKEFGDEGYYYISYYEPTLCKTQGVCFVVTDTPNYNKLYQYDFTGYITSYTDNNPNITPTYTNYFESNGNDMIAAVGTYLFTNAGDYEITIYVNDTEVHRQSGKAMYDGYQTIELDKLIEINKGDIFAIKIKSKKMAVSYDVRSNFLLGSSIREYNNRITDLIAIKAPACIKAYTLPAGSDSFKTLEEEINNAGDVLTLKHDYTYNIGYDSGAVTIERDNFILDGANHTINANGQTGIFNVTGANVTLKNLILINGNATEFGGAIKSYENIAVINCKFENNTAGYSGGAIASKGHLTAINSTFTRNSAGFGGAICAYSSLELYNSSFTQNTATQNGGAAYAYNATVTSTTFENNTAQWSGAICIGENGEINNCTFNTNSATYSGAIQSDENLTVRNSIFKGNVAYESVGAISFYGTGTIDGCTFENNTAPYCGAAYIDGNVTIENTEFKNNTAITGNDIATDDYAVLKLNNVTPRDLTPTALVELQIDDEINTTYGNSVKITAKLIYNTVNEGNVSITVNGKTYSADVKNNTATIEIPGLDAGSYSAEVTFNGGEKYTPDTKTAKFTVEKRNTEITADNKAYVISYGGTYSITVKNLASSVEVTFTLNDMIIGTAHTDENGMATITLTPQTLKNAKSGTKDLKITINDKNHNTQTKTTKITINKEKTKITAKNKKFKSKQKTKKYTITLKDSKGKAIKKAKVTLKVKGKTYKAKTNSKGKATFKITKLTKKGTYKTTITYKGNTYYKKTTKKAKIKCR